MEPKEHKQRTPDKNVGPLDVVDLHDDSFNDDFYFEDGDMGFIDPDEHKKTLAEQKQRIEALKRAIDIAKLMSNVLTDDVIDIANKVLDYMQNTKI